MTYRSEVIVTDRLIQTNRGVALVGDTPTSMTTRVAVSLQGTMTFGVNPHENRRQDRFFITRDTSNDRTMFLDGPLEDIPDRSRITLRSRAPSVRPPAEFSNLMARTVEALTMVSGSMSPSSVQRLREIRSELKLMIGDDEVTSNPRLFVRR